MSLWCVFVNPLVTLPRKMLRTLFFNYLEQRPIKTCTYIYFLHSTTAIGIIIWKFVVVTHKHVLFVI